MDIVQHSEFWIGLFKIIWVNILLSGDNAVVIALASRSLPQRQQLHAIIWGSVAAIIMLVLLTLFAVELLQLPWLKLVGSIMLLWVGIQLMEQNDEDADIKEATSLLGAIKTILIADLVMSLDNVLAVAGTAHSAPAGVREFLVVIGLSLSIPVVIFGSKLVLKLMERFSIIVTLGAMLIGWIAGEMFASEPIVETHVVHVTLTMHYVFAAVGVLLVVAIAKWRERRRIERVEAAQ